MKIFLNDQSIDISSEISLNDFLQKQDISPDGIAVAINEEVVPRSEWDTTSLCENDSVLVIRAAQGG